MKNKQTTDLLPFRRSKQLPFLILDNPSLLFFINFTAAMFFIPMGFVFSWLLIVLGTLASNTSIDGLTAFYNVFYPSLTIIPATIIAGLGMCGVYGVIHDLVTKDVSKYSHFWSSIKDNWKQFCWYYGIIGLLLFLVLINFAGYAYLDIAPFFKLVSLTISIVLLVLFIFIKPFVLFQICMFNNSLIQIIRNSIGFIGKRFLFNLLAFVIGLFAYGLIIFLPGTFRVFAIVVFASFWIMFSSLTNYIICVDTLEKKLPRNQTQDFYHKGLEE